MVDPRISATLLELLSRMDLETQRSILEHAKKVAEQPTAEQRQANWLAFLASRSGAAFDDEMAIAIEESGFIPAAFWHPHESIY